MIIYLQNIINYKAASHHLCQANSPTYPMGNRVNSHQLLQLYPKVPWPNLHYKATIFTLSYVYTGIHQVEGIYHHHVHFLEPLSSTDNVKAALLLQNSPTQMDGSFDINKTKDISLVLQVYSYKRECNHILLLRIAVSHPKPDLIGRISDIRNAWWYWLVKKSILITVKPFT